ncbi:MAG: efflux RND transporter periplasmic adaptor subunit [Verrucomicrobiales bacterium]|nr:efflux RND transporter periplasmic adaptor subunit [Verrucomicrobiales bacterium]
MNSSTYTAAIRKSVKWLLLVVIAAAGIYHMKFASVPVDTFEVKRNVVVGEVMGTGTLEARISTIISTRIQERLTEVLVEQGDAVAAGQLLARLDDGELRLQVEVAEAMLAGARATAERVRVDELRAEAVEEQARQNHQRVMELAVQQVSSTAERDKAIELLRVAESDLQRARAATLEARQQVVTAEKNLAYQQERLGFATILSPYDGLITRRDRDPGGVVVPGSSLLQLVSTNELWISAWVDETAASALALGQPASVVFRSEPDRDYPGEVARLGRETDRETREFLVDVRVQGLPPNWTVGQRAEVYIETGRKADILALPQRFLHWRNGQPGVFVATDGRARWTDVRPGLHGQGVVEIVEGLSSGDQVVMPAGPKQSPLKAGQRVAAK